MGSARTTRATVRQDITRSPDAIVYKIGPLIRALRAENQLHNVFDADPGDGSGSLQVTAVRSYLYLHIQRQPVNARSLTCPQRARAVRSPTPPQAAVERKIKLRWRRAENGQHTFFGDAGQDLGCFDEMPGESRQSPMRDDKIDVLRGV